MSVLSSAVNNVTEEPQQPSDTVSPGAVVSPEDAAAAAHEAKVNAILGGMFSSIGGVSRPGGTALNTGAVDEETYVYKSPLTTLETIRTISNIIVGATKNYDSLIEVLAKDDIAMQQQTQPDSGLTSIPGFDIEKI